MTILSQVNAEKFANSVRTVFPENKIFDPLDYWDIFNSMRDIPLGKHTFKKYLSIICDSRYFPGLSRVRDNSTAPYRYFIDTTGELIVSSTVVETKIAVKPKKGLSPSISDESLINFAKKLEPLMMLGTWYLPTTLARKYNSRYKKHLRPDTLKDYLSQSFRRGLWSGLSRKPGRRNTLSYRIEAAFSFRGKSAQTSTTKNVVQEKGTAPSRKNTLWCNSVQCGKCKGENPPVARFCMLCGEGMRISLKVVVQESVFTVPVNMAGLTSPDDLISLVRGHISCHAEVVVVDGDEGNGEKVYTVTVKE